MADMSDPEKLSTYEDEEASSDSLYIDGVLSNKEGVETPEAVPADEVPRESKPRELRRLFLIALASSLLLIAGFAADFALNHTVRMIGIRYFDEPPVRLSLPALYPDITLLPGSDCHKAWHALTSVPCHEWLVDSENDDEERDIFDLVSIPEICHPSCHTALVAAHDSLAASCTTLDVFQPHFNGAVASKAEPASVVAKLLRTNEHFCRRRPNDDSGFGFCAIEMAVVFGVNDGISADLTGIDHFIEGTKKKAREQTGAGEMSCGFCVFDFLNRSLYSWTENTTVDPQTGLPVPLTEYLRRVQVAGHRCASSNAWNEMFNKAVSRYMKSGLLGPSDVDDLTRPAHDLEYLVTNGPSVNEEPIPEIKAKLASLRLTHHTTPDTIAAEVCLESLAQQYLSLPCTLHLSEAQYEAILNEPPSDTNLRTTYCREECTSALTRHNLLNCGLARPSDNPPPETHDLLSQYLTSVRRREHFCRLTTPVFPTDNCAKALVLMGRTTWATTVATLTVASAAHWEFGSVEPVPFSEIDAELSKLAARAPAHPLPGQQLNLKLDPAVVAGGAQKPIGGRRGAMHGDDTAVRWWRAELEASVCAGCFYSWVLAGVMQRAAARLDRDGTKVLVEEVEYVQFAKRYHSTCTALGADWLEGSVRYLGNPADWQVRGVDGKVVT